MSETSKQGPAYVTNSSATGDEDRRRFVAHLRHELRTSLTAVIGYSEDLHETLHDAPPEIQRDLRALRGAGEAVLGRIDEHLGADAIEKLESNALPRVVRELSAACKEPASAIAALCTSLLAAAEGAGLYAAIPTLCRIQAAGVILRELLDGYGLESTPRVYLSLLPSESGGARDEDAPQVPLQRGRLLVADDNSVTRDVLRQWLTRQGHEVDEVGGGVEALERVRQTNYDIILLDLVMPDLSGLEVLEVMRAEGRIGWAPIVMISALDEFDEVVRCIERGADDFVTKPFNTVLLRTRIRNYLELKRYRDRERTHQASLREMRGGADGR